MCRTLRLEFAGALYHITSRCNGRNLLYLQDDVFVFFCKIQDLTSARLSTWSSDSSSVKGVKQLKVRLGIDEVVSNPALLIELALFCEANKNYQFAFYLISEASILAPNNDLIIKKLVEYEGLLNHPTPGTS
jgi:hypothetical protein